MGSEALDRAVEAAECVTRDEALATLRAEGWLPVSLRADGFLSGARLVARMVVQARSRCWWDAPPGRHEEVLAAAARRVMDSEVTIARRTLSDMDEASAQGARYAAGAVLRALGMPD